MPFHVRISSRSSRSKDEVVLDLSREQLEDRILKPYRRGLPIVTGGKTIPLEDIERLRISYTDEPASELIPRIKARLQAQRDRSGVVVLGGPGPSWYVPNEGTNLTDELITGPPGGESASEESRADEESEDAESRQVQKREERSRRVMVVHGRDARLRDAMFEFLRSLDLDPLEWTELVRLTGTASPYVGDVLDAGFETAQAVVILLTPDDEARLAPRLVSDTDPAHERDLTGQARPNVLFEAGMAFGRFPTRSVIVEIGNLRPFSDVGGRHTIHLDNSTQRRQEFAMRLRHAGCPAKIEDRTGWHNAGDFAPPT
jgi:predicted nucleotide-binding protein